MAKNRINNLLYFLFIGMIFLTGCSSDNNLPSDGDNTNNYELNETDDESTIIEDEITTENNPITEDEAMVLVDEWMMVSEGYQVGELISGGEYISNGDESLPNGEYIVIYENDTEITCYVDKYLRDVYYVIDSEGNTKKLHEENYINKVTQFYEDEEDYEEPYIEENVGFEQGVSMDNYKRIKKGMSYQEVEEILGAGTLNEVDDSTSKYIWLKKGAMGVIEVVFSNDTGEVIVKMPFYLTD